jgi:predicted transcriptional regulator
MRIAKTEDTQTITNEDDFIQGTSSGTVLNKLKKSKKRYNSLKSFIIIY